MNDVALTNENGLIGSMLIDEDCITKVMGIVSADDLHSPVNRDIFETIIGMYFERKKIDPITVSAAIRSLGQPNVNEYIRDLMLITPTALNAEAYADEIRKASNMRRINELITAAMATHADPDNLTDAIMEGLYSIERGNKRGKAETLKNALNGFIDWITSSEPDERINTGYPRIDEILQGMRPGNLVLCAARPAVGKSAFSAEVALRAAEQGNTTVFFTCEMADIEIVQRYVANRADVDLTDITNRELANDYRNKDKVNEAVKKLSASPLYIYDEPGVTVADVRRTLQTIKDVKFAVIDYLQLMKAIGKSENRNLELANICGELKRMAREFKIPILALSQLNRERDEYDEPGLTALRDSGSLEQDADKVLMIWKLERPENGELPKVGFKIAKNRMSKTGTVVMKFDGSRMKFYETDEEYVARQRGRGRQLVPVNVRDEDLPWSD